MFSVCVSPVAVLLQSSVAWEIINPEEHVDEDLSYIFLLLQRGNKIVFCQKEKSADEKRCDGRKQNEKIRAGGGSIFSFRFFIAEKTKFFHGAFLLLAS